MRLRRMLSPEFAHPSRRYAVEDGVRLAAQDGVDRVALRDVEAQLDAVGIAIGLRGLGPLTEVRIADQHVSATRLGFGHHVRPGGRHGSDVGLGGRRPRRQDERELQRELVEEFGVGPSEVERDDRVVAGLGDDAAREVARRRLARAPSRADDPREEMSPGRQLVLDRPELPHPLEREPDIPGPDDAAGRVVDVRAEYEAVRAAPVLCGRQGDREVGDDLRSVAPGDVLKSGQAVAGHTVRAGPIRWNRRARGRSTSNPARVPRRRSVPPRWAVPELRVPTHSAVAGMDQARRPAPDGDPVDHRRCVRVDAIDDIRELLGDPDAVGSDGDRVRPVTDGDRSPS